MQQNAPKLLFVVRIKPAMLLKKTSGVSC